MTVDRRLGSDLRIISALNPRQVTCVSPLAQLICNRIIIRDYSSFRNISTYSFPDEVADITVSVYLSDYELSKDASKKLQC